MLTNTKVLIAACKELNIDFEFLHPDRDFVKIKINSSSYFFLNSVLDRVSGIDMTHALTIDLNANWERLWWIGPVLDDAIVEFFAL